MEIQSGSISSAIPSNSSAQIYQPNKSSSTLNIPFLLALGFGIILLVATYNYLVKIIKSAVYVESVSKFPCGRCRYFNNNYYIKCAIHPSNVLTERSVDCRDYQEEQSRSNRSQL
jgi:hypothetical protein